jgi:putative transcriptional regulator
MNIKIRNTFAEITGASLAMIWMWLNLTEASLMTIQAVSKVLAQGIGGSIILIIALHIIFNILSSIITGQYEEDIDDERDKIFELYALQVSSAIFGISIVATLVLLGWFNLTIISGPYCYYFFRIYSKYFESDIKDLPLQVEMFKKKIQIENAVRKLRFNNDEMTQQQLAEEVGVSRQTIVAIEKYKYTPSLDLAFKIALAFEYGDTRGFFYKSVIFIRRK